MTRPRSSSSSPAVKVDPAALAVQVYPNPVLRTRAQEVAPSPQVAEVARRMIELMHEHEGIGLAAPQVGLAWRLFVTFVPPSDKWLVDSEPPSAEAAACVYLNPVLSDPAGGVVPYEEGCLSLPEITGSVLRPSEITINATDATGKAFTRRGAGLLARCWQHEVDHLDGVLILDRMSQLHRMKNRRLVKALEAEA